MKWEPIETAPKDGTEILAYATGGFYTVTQWVDDTEGWLWSFSTPLTHWMPLPVPPESESA